MMYVLPTGGFNPGKHHSWVDCAKAELSEEVKLCKPPHIKSSHSNASPYTNVRGNVKTLLDSDSSCRFCHTGLPEGGGVVLSAA